MINFRYHLMSLMAVFLSLALGIALGSTVVKEGVLEQLNDRIDSVSEEKQATEARNAELVQDNRRARDYIAATAPLAVADRLTNQDVIVFAMRGVRADTVESEIALLQAAGADAPAVVWLEPSWTFATAKQRSDMRSIVGVRVDDEDLAREGLQALARRFAESPATTTPSTVTESTAAPDKDERTDTLIAMREAGFVTIEAKGERGRSDLSDFPSERASVVAIVGMGTRVDEGNFVEGFVETIGKAFVSESIPVVVGEHDLVTIQTDRGVAIRKLRTSDSVSTVDSMDLVEGRVAAVLAVAALRNGDVGHFGYGPDTSGAIPEQ